MMKSKTGKHQEREKLKEETDFDKEAYGSISGVAQAGAGSLFTYWIKHSSGRPIFDKMANWVGPNIVSKITKKAVPEAIKSADYWITVTAMVFVGTLFLIPLKYFEDRKIGIVEHRVRKNNEKRALQGNPITPEEEQRQQKLLEELKAEPKQNWSSLLIARAGSLVPVYASLWMLDEQNKTLEAKFQKFSKWFTKKAGLPKIAESQVFHNASGIAFYDGFYSMISSGGLYIFSHFINPPKEKVPNLTKGDDLKFAPHSDSDSANEKPSLAAASPKKSHKNTFQLEERPNSIVGDVQVHKPISHQEYALN